MACAVSVVAAEPPSLSRLVSAAIVPGKITEVSLHGDDLEQAVGLWPSFEAKWERVSASNEVVVFRIEPLSKYSAGLGTLRVIGSNGVSSLKFVMLDGLSTITANKTND